MIRVLKLQRVGLINPTVVEYKGKVLATNQLDIESTCNLWRCHFGFYPTEKIDLAMTKKEFSVIQQKTLSSVKSVYDLFYEYNFIPRVFDSNEEVSEWNMYRTNEVEKLKSENTALRKEADENAALSMENKMRADRLETENAALRERLEKAVELPFFKKATKLDWNPLTQESTLIEIYLLIYEDFDGYLCYNEIKDKEAAEARLAELKGEKK